MWSYPKSWRQRAKAEEMLGVMLDAAEAEGRTRPTLAESVDVIRHGLQARLRSAIGALPAELRVRVAQVAMVSGGALALTLLVLGEVGIPGARPLFPRMDYAAYAPWCDCTPPAGLPERLGPFQGWGALVYIGWALILLAWALGKPKLLRAVTLSTLALTALVPHLSDVTQRQHPPYTLLIALGLLNAFALLAPSDPPRRSQRLWPVVATFVGAGALVGWRLYALRGFGADNMARARACFYWCGLKAYPNSDGSLLENSGHGGAAAISHAASGWVAVAAIVGVCAWRWDRTWLAASAVAALPWLVIASRDRYWIWGFPTTFASSGPSRTTLSVAAATWIAGSAIAIWLAAMRSHRTTKATPRADRRPCRPNSTRPLPTLVETAEGLASDRRPRRDRVS